MAVVLGKDAPQAQLFGFLFKEMARFPPSQERTAYLARLWKQAEVYEFSWADMRADEALLVLGLAMKGPDPNPEAEGKEIVFYLGPGRELVIEDGKVRTIAAGERGPA